MMRNWYRAAACGAIVFLGGASVAAAQGPKVTLGFLGGLNSATLSAEDDDGVDIGRRTGFMAGGFLTIHLGQRAFIEPQVLYSQQGAEATDGVDAVEVEVDYISIPVLFGVSLGRADASVVPSIFVGPALNIQAKCNLTFTVGSISDSETCDENGETITKSTDLSGIVGARVDIRAGRGSLRLGGQYGLGFTDLNDDVDAVKNRVWSFFAGFGWPLGSR